MQKGLKYGAGLIALYLGVVYFSGSGALLLNGSQGAANVISAFQGRAVTSSTPAQK